MAPLAALALVSCGKSAETVPGIRAYSEHYEFRITTDPIPPRARERTTFKILVRDKATRQPVDGGEGLIYGNPQDPTIKVWDSFVGSPEPGTYSANLHFVIAGNWFLAIRFRKDSTQKLEQVDWTQEISNAKSEAP